MHLCIWDSLFLSKQLCHIENETLCLFPTEAWVGGRLSVYLVVLLTAVLKIALDHKTLDHPLYVLGVTAAVEDLLGNTYLLKILFARV